MLYSPASLTLSNIGDGKNTYTNGAAMTHGILKMQTAFNADTPTGNITVTASFSGGPITACWFLIEEWSGDATSGQPDGTPIAGLAAYSGEGKSLSVGNITTSVDGADIWCVMFQSQSVSPSAGPGFTVASKGLANGLIYSAHKVQNKAGTTTPNWVSGKNSFDNYIGAMAFKPVKADPENKRTSLQVLGVACSIWAAKRLEQNPTLSRRDLIVPERFLLGSQKRLLLPRKRP